MSSRRGEFVLTEQTIEIKKNLPHKRKKILLEACATICQHSTAQQRWEMKYLFYEIVAKKNNENTVKFVSKIKLREKMIALSGCQWNKRIYDIDPRLPWLVVGVSIMKKRMNSTGVRTGEIGSSSSTLFKRGSGVSPLGRFIFSRHNIKKVISSWIRRRRSLSLDKTMKMDHDKTMKMDHDNLRKSCIGKLPDKFGT